MGPGGRRHRMDLWMRGSTAGLPSHLCPVFRGQMSADVQECYLRVTGSPAVVPAATIKPGSVAKNGSGIADQWRKFQIPAHEPALLAPPAREDPAAPRAVRLYSRGNTEPADGEEKHPRHPATERESRPLRLEREEQEQERPASVATATTARRAGRGVDKQFIRRKAGIMVGIIWLILYF